MRRRIVSVITLLMMLLTVFALPMPAMAAEVGITGGQFDDDDIEYPVDGGVIYFDKATGTITGYGNYYDPNSEDAEIFPLKAVIPESIDGVKVKSVGECAFNCCYIESIVLPDGLLNIEPYAFEGALLKSIILPDSITKIGECAFGSCWDMTDIRLPENLVSIGSSAFYLCEKLKTITFPKNVAKIQGFLFEDCFDLTSINVDTENKNYSSKDGVLFNKDQTKLIQYPEGKAGREYKIPATVTTISNYAFYGCELRSVTVPNSVTKIGTQAFYACDNLMLYVREGSYAHTYAKNNGIKYAILVGDKISIKSAKATLNTLYWKYSGTQRKPVPKVTFNGKTLAKGTDYTVSYGTNKYPGYGYIYITGKGKFTGKYTKKFYIARVSGVKTASTGTTTLKLTWTKQSNMTGYKIYKNVAGKYKQIATVKGAANNSYTVKNLAAGKGYSFKVKAYKKIGIKTYNSVLSPSLSAPTKPTKATLTKLTTGSTHYVKAYWKQKSCTGYQVKIARNSGFTSYDKTYTVKSYKTTSLKMSNLKKGKTYYVKVRAYKTYGGKTVYGSWSTYKKLKCK